MDSMKQQREVEIKRNQYLLVAQGKLFRSDIDGAPKQHPKIPLELELSEE